MKYVWGIFLFISGFIGASSIAGSVFSDRDSNSYYIEFETASDQEREAWLQNEASEIERGISAALPKESKGMTVGMRVKGSEVNVEHRRIDVEIQMMSYGVMTMSQTEARKQFIKKTCPVYTRSLLEESNVVLGITVLDARGGKIIKFLNSPLKCKRFA